MSIFKLFNKIDTSLVYTEKEISEFQNYIERKYGKVDEIIHEIVSDGIHLDILVVPPTEKDNFYKLITMGLGAYMMNIPSEYKRFVLPRAELVMYLPPNWDVKSRKDEHFWPIKELINFARIPLKEDSWIGFGHTASKDEALTPYVKNTKFSGFILLDALNLNKDLLKFKLKNRGKIKFYHVFPLYKEELNSIFEDGLETIFNNFTEDTNLIVDDKRASLI